MKVGVTTPTFFYFVFTPKHTYICSMSKKTILTNRNVDEIVHLYQTNELSSTHKLAALFKVTHKVISQILKDNNVPINRRGRQESAIINYEYPTEQPDYILVCKKTGREFNDAINSSGNITDHVKWLYPNYQKPTSSYLARSFYKKNGYFWYDELFDKKEKTYKETRKCRLCDWETEDIINKTGCFVNHIKDVHAKEIGDYLTEFPEDLHLHPTHISKESKKEFLSKEGNYVNCLECGRPMKIVNMTHLKTHNLTPTEYKLKYGIEIITSDASLEIMRQIMIYNNENLQMYSPISNGEREVREFLESNNFVCDVTDRKIIGEGKEIDIIMYEHKIGIEYNGLYYHSSRFKEKWYHHDKLIKANTKGYKLVQIFEDEWVNKRKICEQKLLAIMGVCNSNKIYARKCIIKEIDVDTKNGFLKDNHIQGDDRSTYKLGAYYNDELIGVMTFTKTNKDGLYDLSRYATKIDLRVIGLGSKMLSYFIKHYNPTLITSFADARWTVDRDNNLYTKLGFKLVKHLNPDYRYYKNSISRLERLHKFLFRKQSMNKKYGYSMDMTESEMVEQLGLFKIWDCGLFKYQLDVPQ